MKSVSPKKKLWKLFSLYIRKRDRGICITCGKKDDYRKMHAGHFRHGTLDFDERNINCQCPRCNKWLHGNLGVYAIRLMGLYGENVVGELLTAQEPYRSRAWYLEKIAYYSKLLGMKEKEKRVMCPHRLYPPYCTICHRPKLKKKIKKDNSIQVYD